MWFNRRNKPSPLERHDTSKYQQIDESTVELTERRPADGIIVDKSDWAPWKRTFWRFGPLAGMGALVASTGCIIVPFMVLLWSNNEEVTNWPLQPSVYLSISTNVGNALLRYALGVALPIAWWRHALRGRTVEELHIEWAVGTSLKQALTNWRFLGVTALGAISCGLLGFVGPLLQRASTVVEAVPHRPMSLQLQIAPELPTNWSGTLNSDGSYSTSDAFNVVFRDYLQGTPILTSATGCEGTCIANISAPGLASNPERCTSFDVDIDGHDQLTRWPQEYVGDYLLFQSSLISNCLPGDTWFGPAIPRSIVPSNPASRDPDRESVAISVVYTDTQDYVGTMTISQCWFSSGILNYTVVISSNDTTINFDHNQRERPIVALANNTTPLRPNVTMGTSISNILASSSIIFGSSYAFSGDSVDKALFQQGNLTAFALRQVNKNKNTKRLRLSDPMPAIVSNLNEIMFRGGVAAATEDQALYTIGTIDEGLNLTQTVSGQRIDEVSRFNSEYRFWAGAAAFQAAAMIFNGMIFWGWWRIGRDVSFSPIEIAKAFDAPILQNAYSNGGSEGIVKDIGSKLLRYGVQREDLKEGVDSVNSEGNPPVERLVFGKYEDIRSPRKMQQFTA